MAHAIQIADDTRILVSRVVAQNGHRLTANALDLQCKATLRDVRATQYNRTNQFEVERQLDGLEEKFAVLNNDALANALSESRTKLAAISYEYSPELLSLLLLLSDRPAEKARLDEIRPDIYGESTSALTWKDIIADDPLEDDSIWDYIENGSHSSGYVSHDEDYKVKTLRASSENHFLDSDEQHSLINTHSIRPAKFDLASFRDSKTQLGQKPDPSQVIRDVVRGLQGLSKSIPAPVEDASGMLASSTVQPIIATLQSTCLQLSRLRAWSRSHSSDMLTQCLKHNSSQWFNELDSELARIEEACMDEDVDLSLTLPAILNTVDAISQPLILLHQIVDEANDKSRPWEVLEILYNQCVMLDLSAQPDLFQRFASLFRTMLLMYLSPFGVWTSQGALTQTSSSVPFVRKAHGSADLGSLWYEHYEVKLRGESPDTVLFMRKHVNRMFVCGKSAAFLNALKQDPGQIPTASDYFTEEVILGIGDVGLTTFVERFGKALHLWLHDSYAVSAGQLTKTLFTKYHLGEVVAAVGKLFLGGDGLNMDDFGQPLYDSLNSGATLSDIGRTTLTALAQSSFETELGKAHLQHALTVSLTPSASPEDHLGGLSVHLSLPWPIQNIAREREPAVCQKAFVTLLRLHRARYLLAQLSLRELAGKDEDQRARLIRLRHSLRWLFDTLYASMCEAGSELTLALSLGIKESKDIEAMADAYQKFSNGVASAFILGDEAKAAMRSLMTLVSMPERLRALWSETNGTDDTGRLLAKLQREFRTESSNLTSALQLMKSETGAMTRLSSQLTALRTEIR